MPLFFYLFSFSDSSSFPASLYNPKYKTSAGEHSEISKPTRDRPEPFTTADARKGECDEREYDHENKITQLNIASEQQKTRKIEH